MKLEYEVTKPSPKFRARLYRNGSLFATGSATVSGRNVQFYPTHPKRLGIGLSGTIKLKVKQKQPLLLLRISDMLLEMSSENIWYFEIVDQIRPA